MLQFNVFPGGKKRIVTFSYDDGPEQDGRLIDLFRKYGVKGTFHLNSPRFSAMTEEEREKIRERYRGMEISCHTVRHGWLEKMPAVSRLRETFEDRAALEELAGYVVRGMSYPSGTFDDEVKQTLRASGIVYSRTTVATNGFALPKDFLEWNPTCHHKGAEALIPFFIENLDSEWRQPLFYIWGHAHEFRTEEDWAMIERIVSSLGGNDKIWYATNIEIYDYWHAARELRVSADERTLENPTATDVWVERDKREIIRVPAGETLRLSK